MLNLFIITIAAFLYLYAGMYYTIFIDGDPDVFNFKRFSLDFEEDSPNYTIILGYILMYVFLVFWLPITLICLILEICSYKTYKRDRNRYFNTLKNYFPWMKKEN